MVNLFLSLNSILQARLIANFFKRLSTEGLIVFMTIYLAMEIGSFTAGLVAILILSIGVYFNTLGGLLTEKVPLKIAMIVGEFAHSLSILGMFIFVDFSLTGVLVCYGLKAIVFSLTTPFGEKLIFDNSDTDKRKATYQINYWLVNLSVPIGMAIGASLFEYGMSILMLASFGFSLITTVIYWISLGYISLSESNIKFKKREKVRFREYKRVFKNRASSLIIISSACLCVLEFSFLQYFPVYITSSETVFILNGVNINQTDIFAISRSINALVILILGFLLASYVADHVGFKAVSFVVLAFVLFFISSFYLLDFPYMFFFTIGLMSIMEIVYSPVRQAMFSETVESSISGLYFSAYSLTGRIGNIGAAGILMISEFVSHNIIIVILLTFGLISFYCLFIASKVLVKDTSVYELY